MYSSALLLKPTVNSQKYLGMTTMAPVTHGFDDFGRRDFGSDHELYHDNSPQPVQIHTSLSLLL